MPVYYLETSALMKKYRTETGTQVVEELFQQKQGSEVFVTSQFTVIEITSIATRLLRARELSRRSYQGILGNVTRETSGNIRLESISNDVVSEAIRMTQLHALRAPDDVHLATAVIVKEASRDEPFCLFGSDARLNASCKSSGIAVINPEERDAINALRDYRGGG